MIDAVGRALDDGQAASTGSARWSRNPKRIDLAAAEERFEALQKRFGDTVGLVHGQMRGAEKDRAMARFAAGETRILVATTVIEVGVDVPAADHHGDRARRALRARAAAPAARPHRPRHASARPASCSTRRRSARRRRRGSRSCARPTTASASPRKICGCAAKATCSARARAACPASASPAPRSTASCSAQRATTRRSC